MSQSKTLIETMTWNKPNTGMIGNKTSDQSHKIEKKKWCCKQCKGWVYHTNDKCIMLEKKKSALVQQNNKSRQQTKEGNQE